MPSLRTANRIPAFTLVEVLVVAAIIALLLAILLPSLTRVRRASQYAICLNNMRELVRFTQFFATDHDGHMPRSSHSAYVGFPTFSEVAQTKWDYAFYRYATGEPLRQGVLGGPSWLRVVNNQYRCPRVERLATASNPEPTSYGYNNWFEVDSPSDQMLLQTFMPGAKPYRLLSRIPNPHATIVFGERKGATSGPGGLDHMMAHFWALGFLSGEDIEVDRKRHDGKSVYAFLDGHAESLRFEDTFAPDRNVDDWNPLAAQ